MPEGQNYAVDSKNVTASAGSASESLTSRDIHCDSVYLFPAEGNTGDVYVVDPEDVSKNIAIPTAGITIPVNNPSLIQVAADTSGDDIEWVAV